MTDFSSQPRSDAFRPAKGCPFLRGDHRADDLGETVPSVLSKICGAARPYPRNGLRFWVLSDIRIDRAPGFRLPDPLPDFDAMLVAGGIAPGIDAALNWLSSELDGRQRDRPVVFVPGGVEFWSDVPMHEALDQGRELARRLGLVLLHDEYLRLGAPNRPGVQLLGSTLWTDWALEGAFEGQLARVYARHSWPHRERVWIRHGHPLSPIDAAGLHARSRAYLEDALTGIVHQSTLRCSAPPNALIDGVAPDDVAVVLTHFAPSRRSLPTHWAGWHGNPCEPASRASNLEALMLRWGAPALWVHGNVPAPVDYRFGRTRVVANPGRTTGSTLEFDDGGLIQL